MKGQAFIERLRARGEQLIPTRDEQRLLADAVDLADEASREVILLEPFNRWENGAMWYDTARVMPTAKGHVARALSYLDRRGLIERKEGEPHMVRFRD